MGTTLTDADICRAAKKLRCDTAAIQAVSQIEAPAGGFYPNGFPTILFERHLFRKWTQGRYNKSNPDISGPAGNYGAPGQHQIDKFNKAFALSPQAAMKSCSWGKYQILGENYEVCGYDSVDAFVDAMKDSEGKQLDAFVGFVIGNGLDKFLRSHSWTPFANGYNGHGQHEHYYDDQIANAWLKCSKHPIDCTSSAAGSMPAPLASDSESELSPDPAGSLAGQPDNPPPTVTPGDTVVEKEQDVGFFAKIKLKLAGWFGTLGGLTGLTQYKQQIDDLGLPGWIVLYVLAGAAVAFLGWLAYEGISHLLDKWRKRSLTNALVKANGTSSNTVIVACEDDLDKFAAMGYNVVRRQQPVPENA